MKTLLAALLTILYCISVTQAYAAESVQTAKNGVDISINSDEFADRYEYTAPTIKLGDSGSIYGDSGSIMLARTKSSGSLSPIMIQGFIMYHDDWRRYSSAIFRGGEQVSFENVQRKVVSCRSKPCTMSEMFIISLTMEQIEKHIAEGVLQIQVRGTSAQTFMVEIPENYLQALVEVTKGG